MTTKPMRRDAIGNRARLIAAASQVFADEGVDAPVEAIAREAGVGTGTFYRHFPTKQALVDEVVGSLRTELLRLADTALERTDGSGLEELLFAVGRLQADQSGCVRRMWVHVAVEPAVIEGFRARVAALLDAAQQHGLVRYDVTPSDISMLFWSVGSIIETTHDEAPRAWRRHLELLIAGLRTGPAFREAPLSAAAHRRIVAHR